MAKVYVVTKGEYSDQSISGIFSTREKADQFIIDNPITRYDGYNDVEEWVLDEKEEYTSKTIWECNLDTETGDIISERTSLKSCGHQHTDGCSGSNITWGESSVSQEHARKIAVEKRQEALRFQALKVTPGKTRRDHGPPQLSSF